MVLFDSQVDIFFGFVIHRRKKDISKESKNKWVGITLKGSLKGSH